MSSMSSIVSISATPHGDSGCKICAASLKLDIDNFAYHLTLLTSDCWHFETAFPSGTYQELPFLLSSGQRAYR